MALTLAELLNLPVLAAAEPELLVPDADLNVPVRWVHSSEIYEMAPLLSAGDLLLTTGLGLVGRGRHDHRQYVQDLADVGVSGVLFELGRSFSTLPDDLMQEATRSRLPLVALHKVVPFIRIAEAANTRIVDGSGHQLRLSDEVTRQLNVTLMAGGGIGRLLQTTAGITGTTMVLVAATGALVTAHGVDSDRDAWRAVDEAGGEAAVTLHGQHWGRLVAGAGGPLSPTELQTALERAAVAIALAMLQAGRPPTGYDRQVAALLADLAGPDGIGEADLVIRAATAGFTPIPGHHLLGVAADCPESGPAYTVIERAARELGTPVLRARVVNSVLGVLLVPPGNVDVVGVAKTALVQARSRVGAEMRLGLGHAIDSARGLTAVRPSLRDARAVLALSGTLGGRTVATAADAALELQLIRHHDRPALALLGTSTLSPLIGWDTHRRTALVWTLEIYLRHGCSPTRTATALHLGRQSLYQRLDRIKLLLGYAIEDPDRHAGLLLAATAHRLAGL